MSLGKELDMPWTVDHVAVVSPPLGFRLRKRQVFPATPAEANTCVLSGHSTGAKFERVSNNCSRVPCAAPH